MVSKLLGICVKNSLIAIWQRFPPLFLSYPFFFHPSFFYSRPLCFIFRLPSFPLFSGSGSPSWGSNCHIEGKRGSRAFFSGYGKSATAAILRDRAPTFLGMSIGYAYIPGRYVSLVGSCMFHVLLCHLAEVIHAGAEIAAWPTWCFYVLNKIAPVVMSFT